MSYNRGAYHMLRKFRGVEGYWTSWIVWYVELQRWSKAWEAEMERLRTWETWLRPM